MLKINGKITTICVTLILTRPSKGFSFHGFLWYVISNNVYFFAFLEELPNSNSIRNFLHSNLNLNFQQWKCNLLSHFFYLILQMKIPFSQYQWMDRQLPHKEVSEYLVLCIIDSNRTFSLFHCKLSKIQWYFMDENV